MKTFIFTFIFSISALAAGNSATYEVPTSQPELKSVSQFNLEQVSLSLKNNGQMKLKYQVPRELTGLANNLEFSGTLSNDNAELDSEYGHMSCLKSPTSMMCTVNYSNLAIDGERAKEIMANKFDAAELPLRLQVLEKFSTDPIGVIRVQLKKNSGRKN